MQRVVSYAIWAALGFAILVPLGIALASPLLASRNPAYIVASIAGIFCLGLFLVQPLLAAGYLPGLRQSNIRKAHRLVGLAIAVSVFLHVGGLYLTSPPDALDALLLVSPTPFSVYGVIALWGVVLTVLLVALRKRLNFRYTSWRFLHNLLALVVVISTIIHALQIEGTMGTVSKWTLCIFVLVATVVVLIDLRIVRPFLGQRSAATKASQD